MDGISDLTPGEIMDGQCDVTNDICVSVLEEGAQSHQALMGESRANALNAHSVVRHSAARKFNQEDPIEAAAAEMILTRPT